VKDGVKISLYIKLNVGKDAGLHSRIPRRGPVVFCYARPEDPDGQHREYREEHFEHATIDIAVRAIADVHRCHELEDLTDGEKEPGSGEVDCGDVSGLANTPLVLSLHRGLVSPRTLRTRKTSSAKNRTMNTKGASK
jgi:hypothetical protein